MQESDEHPLSHLTPVGYKPMAPCDSQCGANLRRWHPAVGRGRAVTELIPQALFPEVGFVYLTGINLVTFLVYGADKRRARRGRWRIPEVTLLALALLGGAGGALLAMEAYCAYSDLDGMKRLTEGLFKTIAREVCGCEEGREVITYQGQPVDMSGTWTSRPLADIASEAVGEHVDMDTPIEHLREICEANGIEWQPNWGVGKLVFELYDELGEATIIDPTFVCDYPEEVSPLSKRKDEDNRLTDRFELVISGHGEAHRLQARRRSSGIRGL